MTMKKLVTIGMSAVALPVFAQDASQLGIYGRLNTTLESIHMSTDSEGKSLGNVVRLANNRSVIGFRGDEDLGGGVRTIWQIESAVSIDTGAGTFGARDTRLGLATSLGTVFGGNWTTPYTSATQGIDPFYPTTAGYMSIIGNGSAPSRACYELMDGSGNQLRVWTLVSLIRATLAMKNGSSSPHT
jgi:predicted porin